MSRDQLIADLRKPAPGSGRLARFERKAVKFAADRKAKKAAHVEQHRRNREIRAAIYYRDNGRCRACEAPVYMESDNPFEVLHAHHVIYKSAGGSDLPHNRLSL